MKYNFTIIANVMKTKAVSIEAKSFVDAQRIASETLEHGEFDTSDDSWIEEDTHFARTEVRLIDDQHLDAFKTFDPSYVMDRKAQIDFLEGFLKAWDILGGMNILTEDVINGMTKELHLFYDANHIEHDIAEAVLNRLINSKEYKLQHVEFGSVVHEFVPDEDDYWESDGKFDYHYCEEYGEVCVYYIKPDGDTDTSVTIHKQPIQK